MFWNCFLIKTEPQFSIPISHPLNHWVKLKYCFCTMASLYLFSLFAPHLVFCQLNKPGENMLVQDGIGRSKCFYLSFSLSVMFFHLSAHKRENSASSSWREGNALSASWYLAFQKEVPRQELDFHPWKFVSILEALLQPIYFNCRKHLTGLPLSFWTRWSS